MSTPPIDDLRIRELRPLPLPAEIVREYPATPVIAGRISTTRAALHRILHGQDDRLIVVIGPCSIHDPDAALEYAERLHQQRERLSDALEVVMRVYFEKPRTTVGWKGLINDPALDGSFKIEQGLRLGRRLLRDINALGLPAGSEFLDMITPQYIADLVSWGAIGARTTESQVHRELASGLSCAVGFKNSTEGNIQIAVDAVQAASQPHHFLSATKDGRTAIVATLGNQDCHVILRGGKQPNYDAASVDSVCQALQSVGQPTQVMIDASHGNSRKKPENQPLVISDIADRIACGERRISGVMVESHLRAGRQDLKQGQPLTYGQSITDGCIGWDDSILVLEQLAHAVRKRRLLQATRRSGQSHPVSRAEPVSS